MGIHNYRVYALLNWFSKLFKSRSRIFSIEFSFENSRFKINFPDNGAVIITVFVPMPCVRADLSVQMVSSCLGSHVKKNFFMNSLNQLLPVY